jgi:6-phosphogluconolactonase
MPTKQMTRRSLVVGLATASITSHRIFASTAKPRLLFVGTDTRGKCTSRGIYAYRWLPASGELTSLGLAAESATPAFLALSPDSKYLYAVNEVSDYGGVKDGSVSAFLVDQASGKLTLRNTVSSGGAGPCNIAVDQTSKVAFVANGAGGSLSSYRILRDGSLSEPVTNLHFTGHSINPIRQKTAYTHCTTVSPDNRYVLVNDLGLDRITTFRFDPETAVLTPNDLPYYQAIPGSGPRGFTFHPNRKWAYSVNELLSTVDALAWNNQNGSLTRMQNISTVAPGFSSPSIAATVRVDKTGRFLYVSNRGADTMGVFSIDQARGTLTQIQQISTGGKTPRHFTLDPSERWLLAANQDSANIEILQRNPQTGLLASVGKRYNVGCPMCLIFA